MINLEKVIKKRHGSSLRSLTGNRTTENLQQTGTAADGKVRLLQPSNKHELCTCIGASFNQNATGGPPDF